MNTFLPDADPNNPSCFAAPVWHTSAFNSGAHMVAPDGRAECETGRGWAARVWTPVAPKDLDTTVLCRTCMGARAKRLSAISHQPRVLRSSKSEGGSTSLS